MHEEIQGEMYCGEMQGPDLPIARTFLGQGRLSLKFLPAVILTFLTSFSKRVRISLKW